jgi:hypothetical protein
MPCTTNEPTQESLYFSIINRCNKLVDEIGMKTSFIRIERPEPAEKTPEAPKTQLQRELNGLEYILESLLDSYKL